jgi:hypothetical protein
MECIESYLGKSDFDFLITSRVKWRGFGAVLQYVSVVSGAGLPPDAGL